MADLLVTLVDTASDQRSRVMRTQYVPQVRRCAESYKQGCHADLDADVGSADGTRARLSQGMLVLLRPTGVPVRKPEPMLLALIWSGSWAPPWALVALRYGLISQ